MISLVIPVYLNEKSLPALIEAVAGLNASLEGDFEAVFVVDGSPDNSYLELQQALPEQAFASQLILLSRNFGSFAAIREGLRAARGDAFCVMAADLQEPPELVLTMARELAGGEVDVVVAVREARADPLSARLPAKIFWGLYRRYVMPDVPPGGVDVFACNRAFRDTLLEMRESHSSLIAQIFWLGFRRKFVSYERRAREHGKSAWTLRKKLNYLMDSVFSFTDLPIRLLIRGGALGVLLALMLGVLVVVARVSGAIEVPGYAMTVLVIMFFGALNLLSLGIVGSYAWRTYENTKSRPLAITLRSQTFEPKPDGVPPS